MERRFRRTRHRVVLLTKRRLRLLWCRVVGLAKRRQWLLWRPVERLTVRRLWLLWRPIVGLIERRPMRRLVVQLVEHRLRLTRRNVVSGTIHRAHRAGRGVPLRVALAHRDVHIRLDSSWAVRTIQRPVVVLMVRTIVGVAVIVSDRVARH